MKVLQIFSAIILPLLVGFLNHDVQHAVSNGRWPTAIGSILGFNGLFALVAVILAVVFIVRSQTRAGWISLTVLTLVSAGLSGSAGPLARYVEKTSQQSDESKITAWQQQHRQNVAFELTKCAASKVKTYRASKSGTSVYETTVSGFRFMGSIENKSVAKLSAVVLDLAVVNENKIIVSHRLTFPIEVFPTAKLNFDTTFEPCSYSDDSAATELHRAREQLPNSTWSYELVAAIPDSLESLDLRKSLRVESEFMATIQSKK